MSHHLPSDGMEQLSKPPQQQWGWQTVTVRMLAVVRVQCVAYATHQPYPTLVSAHPGSLFTCSSYPAGDGIISTRFDACLVC